MKRLLSVAIPALLAIGALAGCATQPGAGGATPTPTPTAPPCPVGAWKTTSITANTTISGVSVTFDGGADVSITIGSDGATKADFTGMKPVTFATQVAGAQIKGEYTYAGSTSATVKLAGSATSTPATSGSTSTGTSTATSTATATVPPGSSPWQPGTVNSNDLKVTVKLTQPAALTVVDNVKLSDVTGAQTTQIGNAVDLQPLLRPGSYKCDGNDKLTIIAASGGPVVTWNMARASTAATTTTTTPTPAPSK